MSVVFGIPAQELVEGHRRVPRQGEHRIARYIHFTVRHPRQRRNPSVGDREQGAECFEPGLMPGTLTCLPAQALAASTSAWTLIAHPTDNLGLD